MADEEQLRILREGVIAWLRWREDHPNVRPDLSEANLNGLGLNGALLSDVDLSKAGLRETNLSGAFLRHANLSEANIERALLFGADLSGADLNVADLTQANLRKANLKEANLRKANLNGATLSETDLSGADLSGAHLRAARLNGADLSGVNLRQTLLGEANFSRSRLYGADFSGATVDETAFDDVDLSEAKGLESVVHWGPSTIGIDTVYKSKGRIPDAFLRGCGVPDDFIAYVSSFVAGKAIQFYSCFISYSSKDQAFADRLHADLQAKGVRCWFAPEDMQIGDKIWERLDQSIRLHDKLLVILSGNSIGSAWVEDEVMTAFEEERKRHQTVLFPVRLDDAVLASGEAWAGLVRQRHIGDFRAWKEHDAYRAGFEKLMRDLKAG